MLILVRRTKNQLHISSAFASVAGALLGLLCLSWLLGVSLNSTASGQEKPLNCNSQFATCNSQLASPSLLALYALAFDNTPGSPNSLASYFTPTMQSIVSATAAHPDRVAVVLVDLDGYGDTQVLIAQNGVIVPVDGLPFAPYRDAAVALEGSLSEYDMADGYFVGNFIRWARQLYPVTTTIFSYVGHGAPLVPQTRPLFEGALTPQGTPTPTNTPPATNDPTNPLPPRWGAHTDLTDYHSASLVSIRSLAQALDLGTHGGTNPLTVVDLLHCFAATIEELYEVQPYAQTIIAAPNYAYAEPEMLGHTLAGLQGELSALELAKAIIASYDSELPSAEHPRLLIAVDGGKIAAIKEAWDQTSSQLISAFAADEPKTRAQINAAYQASAKYDTSVCQPQDWQLAPPDALSDMSDFATHLRSEFGNESPVSSWALTTTLAISDALIARYAHDGSPWFADVTPLPIWTFPAAGIGLFTDFAPETIEGLLRFSWQSRWYTRTAFANNPHPYAFVRPSIISGTQLVSTHTWADVFSRFWSQPITTTAECLPGFVNGRGEGALSILTLYPITPSMGITLNLSADVYSIEIATNPLLRFRVYQGEEQVFEDVVGSGYFTPGISRTVQSVVGWRPSQSDTYTIEATIDADNRFVETNEADNVITMTVAITMPQVVYLPVVEK